MKQKKINFENKPQEPVIIDGITLKHFKLDKGEIATFVEIEGKRLDEQVELNAPIERGDDASGYPLKYQIRFNAATNLNTKPLTEGFYKLVTTNAWIDTREDKKDSRILRVGQVEKFECYFEFTKENK